MTGRAARGRFANRGHAARDEEVSPKRPGQTHFVLIRGCFPCEAWLNLAQVSGFLAQAKFIDMNPWLCLSAVMLGARLGAAGTEPVDYLREVKPLLRQRCYACHGALKQKNQLRLDTGEAIRRGGKHGPVILTNDVAKSPLLWRVASTNADERMPAEGEALTPGQVARLRAWIAQGAPSPADEKSEPDPREHWAFRTPRRPPVPRIAQPHASLTHPLDAFILVEQEKRGLKASPPARKEVLLRRVYLDLIGLPPTREELRAFLSDPATDAYEKVVDRLLASRQYAERWARHWMDIWRYADWYGRRHVPDVWNSAPQVWRWRDWIVRSLNADKGYDRMILEMLAADEVAPEDDETRVATGYLVRNWNALNPNQWMRDTVEHTGKAFLALTFNCAHCHDHKYDPITQRDYFQFRAFFEPLQVRQDWVRNEADPGPFQKYAYGETRKVITNGIVSVFDENLDARTFIYLRGDERSLPEGKPTAEPAMPAFLRGDTLKPARLDLPPVARYPGLKPFIREAEMKRRERALVEARDAWATAHQRFKEASACLSPAEATNSLASRAKALANLLAAEMMLRNQSNQLAIAGAELDAARARLTADQARSVSSAMRAREADDADKSAIRPAAPGAKRDENPPSAIEQRLLTPAPTDELAAAASRAERLVLLRKAEAKLSDAEGALALGQAEQAIAAARRIAEGSSEKKEIADAALGKAQELVTIAKTNLAAAQAALRTNSTAYTALTPIYPAQSTGRRRALAEWIASRDNPLTARVAVNHIWARHFHTPLVASVFDFGRNGAQPTHPDLLDWLAVEFMEHGWSMKHLHRLMVTSRAYRQASQVESSDQADAAAEDGSDPPPRSNAPVLRRSNAPVLRHSNALALQRANAAADPENRWLWRMNPGQMEAEVVRDSILHLAGELDLTPVGYPLPNAGAETNRHRSLYFECFPEPTGSSQFAELFDPPNPTECYRRTQTIVPQQALALTNSRLSHERSRSLAQRLAQHFAHTPEPERTVFITAAYEHVLARRPTIDELAACRGFLAKQSNQSKSAEDDDFARASLIHVLFNHHDFVTIR